MKTTLIYTLFYLLSQQAIGQTLVYSVLNDNDSIGYLLVNRVKVGNSERYEINSEVEFSLILSFEMTTHYFAEYKDGFLDNAYTENKMNNNIRSKSSITKEGDYYKIRVDDKELKETKPVTNSVTAFYFNEPKGASLFSERYGKMVPLKKKNEHTYILIQPNGRENTYYFKNGICYKAEINTKLSTVILKLKN